MNYACFEYLHYNLTNLSMFQTQLTPHNSSKIRVLLKLACNIHSNEFFILQFEIEGICNLQSLLKIIDLSTKLTLQVTVLRLGKKT